LGFDELLAESEEIADGLSINQHLAGIAFLDVGGATMVEFEVVDDGRWDFNQPK